MNAIERELKLTPQDPALLDRLAAAPRLGPFEVVDAGRELQRNTFFDTQARALSAARLAFRRRTLAGHDLATWTLKGEGELVRGIAARPEIEVQLAADTPPALVIGAVGQAARHRGAAALAEQLADALASGAPGLPRFAAYLEMSTERRLRMLRAPEAPHAAESWDAELALDRVQLIGHDYSEVELEVELRRGDERALEAARSAIAQLGPVRESHGSKLSRALEHLAACRCPSADQV